MQKKLLSLYIALILIFTFTTQSIKSQTIDFDSKQNLTISAQGFFPFSTVSNNQFKDIQPINPNLTVQFSNFLGNPCAIAPAADFSEIGPQIIVRANGEIVLDFSHAQDTVGQFGLSLVPQGGSCIFDIFIPKPQTTVPSPTPTPEPSISLPPGENLLTPNSLTIFSNYVPDNLVNDLSNEKDNSECKVSSQGIQFIPILSQGSSDTVFVTFFDKNPALKRISKIIRFLSTNSETNSFTLIKTTPKQSMITYSQDLLNSTDMTKVFVTGIYPSQVKELTTSIGLRVLEPNTSFTPKNQSTATTLLASVQHAVISLAMPWQLSGNGGFFITQGGGCVGPLCTIVESGMAIVVPGGACTPEKVTRRKTLFETVNPSKLFASFPISQKTVQIPIVNVVNPNHPKSSAKINTSNGYLIFQPVPPNSKIKQLLNVNIHEPCPNPVKCDNLCSNIGACCLADKNGFTAKACQQFMGGSRCTCLP